MSCRDVVCSFQDIHLWNLCPTGPGQAGGPAQQGSWSHGRRGLLLPAPEGPGGTHGRAEDWVSMLAANLRLEIKKRTVGLQWGPSSIAAIFSLISCWNRFFLKLLRFRELPSLLIVFSVKAVEFAAKTLMFEQQSFLMWPGGRSWWDCEVYC